MTVTKKTSKILVIMLVIISIISSMEVVYGASLTSNSGLSFSNNEIKKLYEKANKTQKSQIQTKSNTIKSRKTYTIQLKKGSGKTYKKEAVEKHTSYGKTVYYQSYPTASSNTTTVITTTTTRIYTKGKKQYQKIVNTVEKSTVKLEVKPKQTAVEVSIEKLVPKIPKAYTDLFKELDCKAYIDKDIKKKKDVVGDYDPLKGILTMEKLGMLEAYHEFGHFIMEIYILFHSKETWIVYEQEKLLYNSIYDSATGINKRYNVAHIRSNRFEFFAEAYKEYYFDNSLLKSTMPKTYKIIEKALDFSSHLSKIKKNSLRILFRDGRK